MRTLRLRAVKLIEESVGGTLISIITAFWVPTLCLNGGKCDQVFALPEIYRTDEKLEFKFDNCAINAIYHIRERDEEVGG